MTDHRPARYGFDWAIGPPGPPRTVRDAQRTGSASAARDVDIACAMGWTSILAGALTGLVLGLWSFGGPVPVPDAIGDYGSLPRRLLRLAHIAFFALGMLHIMVARHIRALPLGPRVDRVGLRFMAFGNIAMPVALIVAAFWEPAKYLTALPASALTLAFAIALAGALSKILGGSDDRTGA